MHLQGLEDGKQKANLGKRETWSPRGSCCALSVAVVAGGGTGCGFSNSAHKQRWLATHVLLPQPLPSSLESSEIPSLGILQAADYQDWTDE